MHGETWWRLSTHPPPRCVTADPGQCFWLRGRLAHLRCFRCVLRHLLHHRHRPGRAGRLHLRGPGEGHMPRMVCDRIFLPPRLVFSPLRRARRSRRTKRRRLRSGRRLQPLPKLTQSLLSTPPPRLTLPRLLRVGRGSSATRGPSRNGHPRSSPSRGPTGRRPQP